jgi:hypothetical protein
MEQLRYGRASTMGKRQGTRALQQRIQPKRDIANIIGELERFKHLAFNKDGWLKAAEAAKYLER